MAVISALCGVAVAWPLAARAQQLCPGDTCFGLCTGPERQFYEGYSGDPAQ
jgi:hypothetical protein